MYPPAFKKWYGLAILVIWKEKGVDGEGDEGSNGNASETKANESFDNDVFFDIEAKRTPSIVSKLFSKRNEHIR